MGIIFNTARILFSMEHQLVKSAIKHHNSIQLDYYAGQVKKTMLPVDSHYVNRHIGEFLQFSQIKPGENILEVGCGMGKFTIPLLKKRISNYWIGPFTIFIAKAFRI